jgi:hypothetical protein
MYEILSESTFFGLKEFKSFVALIQEFKKTDEEPNNFYWEYFQSIDFEDYRKEIKEFIVNMIYKFIYSINYVIIRFILNIRN